MEDDGSIAGRLRRPTWRDPRLLVGVLLMTVAVVGVALALRAAERTDPYYVAASTLVPGTVIDEELLVVTQARVGGSGYLIVGDDPPWGQVVTRTVGAGELVPSAAVAPADVVDGRVLGVVAHAPVAPDVVVGSVVDLWIAHAGDPASGAALVAEDLVVQGVDHDEGAFSVSGGQTVYLAVPSVSVQDVLDALSSDGDVTVVGRGGQ